MANEFSGKVSVDAFSGESKWILILGSASAGALLLCLFGTFYVMGRTLEASNLGLIFGLFAAGTIFVGGMVALYVEGQIKMSPYHHHMLIIRPYKIVFNTHFTEGKYWEEQIDGKPTGWASKQFVLDTPTEFNLPHHEYGLINEYIVHYYGKFNELTELEQGSTVWHDMDIPVGSLEILTVKLVLGSPLNVKHGARVPIFELIGGSKEGKYFNPTVLIPNPNTHYLATTQTGLALANNLSNNELLTTIASQNQKIKDLEITNAEIQRQGEEDKAEAITSQRLNDLNDAENEGLRGVLGKEHTSMITTTQTIVTAHNDWEEALAHMLRGDNKLGNLIPYIVALAGLSFVLIFLGLNPKLTASAVAATQNPLLDTAVIAVVAVGFLAFYYLVIKRRKR